MWRQGDLLIKRTSNVPLSAKKRPNRVILEGEATGHAHRLTEGTVYEHRTGIYFTTSRETDLVHEEHKTISFSAGTYKVIRQREYNPFEKRNVWVLD